MTLRSWAEQTTCVFCNSGTQKVDEINCATCHKVAHLKCVGLGMPVKGHMLWNCLDCGPHSLGALTDIVLELKQKIAALETVPEDIRSLKLEVTTLKPKYSSVVQQTTQNESNSFNPTNRSENGIFGFELAGRSKAPFQPFRSRFNSTNSSKRHKPDDENDDDAMNTEDFQVRKKTMRPQRQNFGTKQSHDDFNGIKKKPSRRHIFLGRLNSNCTETMIRNWCCESGAPVLHLREITKEGSKMKSFHLVFSEEAHETIVEDSFWPSNVVHGRFFLNDDARNWLRSLPPDLSNES